MIGLSDPVPIDGGRSIDWGRTSADYAEHRPEPPARLYELLAGFGVGRPAQRILDLGTGTGIVARALAARVARLCGIDISTEQVCARRAPGSRSTSSSRPPRRARIATRASTSSSPASVGGISTSSAR